MLEVGCGHGYTTAVLASAAGPKCHVDTIEEDPLHADLAEQAFQQRDLSRQITVLRGRGLSILPKLKGRYDVVFLDRSEEHTSELQSLRHLVCRLLLEKKKHI